MVRVKVRTDWKSLLRILLQVQSGDPLCPLLLQQLLHPGVAASDGPVRSLPRGPQQQHQLHHLLPGWQSVQICTDRNVVLTKVPRHQAGGVTDLQI